MITNAHKNITFLLPKELDEKVAHHSLRLCSSDGSSTLSDGTAKHHSRRQFRAMVLGH